MSARSLINLDMTNNPGISVRDAARKGKNVDVTVDNFAECDRNVEDSDATAGANFIVVY